MKNRIILLLFLLFAGVLVKAQSSLLLDSNDRRPYVTINGKEADPLSLLLIDKHQVLDIVVLPKDDSGKFGERGLKFGVVKVTMKKKAKLIPLIDLLANYHIKTEALELPVQVYYYSGMCRLRPTNPKLIISSKSGVHSVGISRRFPDYAPSLLISQMMEIMKKSAQFDSIFEKIYQIFDDEAERRRPDPNIPVIIG